MKSTISNNRAVQGGGIWSWGPMTISDCTISGNRNTAQFYMFPGGGGIKDEGGLVVRNSTIYGNYSPTVGGGLATNGSPVISNSIIAGNSSPDLACANLGSLNYSLIGSKWSVCKIPAGVGNLMNVDPGVGPLASNGGWTRTHALLAGSVAVDGGSPAVPGSGGKACTKIDQRGVLRPQNGRCDIGAYELE